MSIQHFVKGKYTCSVKGDYTVYSNGNIVHNATQSINQKGIDTGVSYKDPKEINPNDTPSDTIDVTFNLFFDGTQNNKRNTKLGNKHKSASKYNDDSYSNDLTNIARGIDAVNPNTESQVSCYIEGIGTEDEKEDSILGGVALGIGSTGVIEKVVKGCKLAANEINKKIKNIDKTINVLKVNVFGFSRGATAARHFVHVANQPARKNFRDGFKKIEISPPKKSKETTFIIDNTDHKSEVFIDKYGYFGACLLERELEINRITFNFAGLYDTVASYGVNHRGLKVGDVTLIDDDTEQLGLDTIGKGKVQFVLQLAADDEYRENFDLTNINSTGLHGLQFTFPGVHSDIGGSYGDGDKEISVLYCVEQDNNNCVLMKEIKKKCEEFKKIVVNEGWYKENELEIKYFTHKDVNYERWWNKGASFYGLVGTRKLSNHYDKIPLKYMFHYSKEQGGVEYLDKRLNEDNKITDAFIKSIDYELLAYAKVCNNIRNRYILEKKTSLSKDYLKELEAVSYLDYIDIDDLKELRNKYLHWSVKSNQIGLDPQRNRDAPNTNEALTAKYRKRHIQNG